MLGLLVVAVAAAAGVLVLLAAQIRLLRREVGALKARLDRLDRLETPAEAPEAQRDFPEGNLLEKQRAAFSTLL